MSEILEAAVGRSVSRETHAKLEHYETLVREENEQQNLVSRASINDLWARHIVDSAQLVRFAPRSDSSWLDIGSGAGLPGVVIAILSHARVALVEPRKLRAAFLQRCVDKLELRNAVVECMKIENLTGHFDVITARAVGSVTALFGMAVHLSHPGTNWVLPKGRSAKSELDEARRTWQGNFRLEASLTDPEASILIATGVRRRTGSGGRE